MLALVLGVVVALVFVPVHGVGVGVVSGVCVRAPLGVLFVFSLAMQLMPSPRQKHVPEFPVFRYTSLRRVLRLIRSSPPSMSISAESCSSRGGAFVLGTHTAAANAVAASVVFVVRMFESAWCVLLRRLGGQLDGTSLAAQPLGQFVLVGHVGAAHLKPQLHGMTNRFRRGAVM